MTQQRVPGGRSPVPVVAGWMFAPEGGVIHLEEHVAVIADVHLGYEWARGAAGDCVPAHSLTETLKKLDLLLARSPVERLVVAGDLVESPRPCLRTAADLARLSSWLTERCVRLVVVEGNHDRSLSRIAGHQRLPAAPPPPLLQSPLLVAGWTIAHGHRPVPANRLITGHHHPVLRVSGHPAPCFLVSDGRIILPAFSSNAAGLDVATARLPQGWGQSSLRRLASTGGEILDFGPLGTLQARLG